MAAAKLADVFAPIRQAVEIRVKPEHKLPIAIVGAGQITDVAHLPAYREHGLDIVGITDLNLDRAKDVAKRHGIPKVYASAAELAADADVAVVDIAVFPWVQYGVAVPLLDAGKDLLCQKPISYDYDEAERLVDHARKKRRVMAVNQQMRFSENMAATKAMLDQGWIGQPYEISWDFHVYTPWEAWPWVTDLPRLDVNQFTIHPIDSTRFLLGEPLYAYGTQAREPGQPQKGETRSISVLEYAGETRAFFRSFHKNRCGDARAEFRIDGTEGAIRGTIGLMYNYPLGRADTLEINSRVIPTDGWMPYPVMTRWFPTAFIGPMASLLEAIANGGTPATDATDNLATLRILRALYRSGEEHVVVKL